MRGGGDRRNYPRLPSIEQDIDENPARWLMVDIDPTPRLRGIDDLRTLNRWLQAEEMCQDRRDVRELIQQRIAAVSAGARGFHAIERNKQPAPDDIDDRDRVSGEDPPVTDVDTDVEASPTAPIATDGGDSCPDCGGETSVHELGEQRALWCRSCSDFVGRLD